MRKALISLQDLRRKIYLKAKSDKTWRGNAVASAGTGGVEPGFIPPWVFSMTTGGGITGLKALPVNRSHKPLDEVSRKARYGETVRRV